MISLGTWPDRQPGLLKEALRFVGIRDYGVEGAVGVRNGRVIGTEFGVTTEATPGSIGGQWIAAVAKISDRFSRSDYSRGHRLGLDDHPNREVIHPHFSTTGGGQVILSEVTADANAVEKDRAFDFRLFLYLRVEGLFRTPRTCALSVGRLDRIFKRTRRAA